MSCPTLAGDSNVARAGAARRRRERRLRSMLRHERQTVAMELAVALHHSRDARSEVAHEVLRGQKTASSGTRPETPEEVSGPQEAAVTVGYVAAARAPSLATPSLADSAGDAVDAAALEFLVWVACKTPEQIERSKQASWRKQRKEAAKKEKESAKGEEEASSSRRRRKKRKKNLPKTQGPLLPQVSVRSCSSSTRWSSSWRRGRSSWSMVTPLVSGSHLFACLACCLVGQWIHVYVGLQRLCGDYFWKKFRIQRIAWFDIGYNICVSLRSLLGDDFVEMFVFSGCGSTVDTCSHVCYGALGFHFFYVKVDTARAVRTRGVDIFVGPVPGSPLFGVCRACSHLARGHYFSHLLLARQWIHV